jgi:hypothetical protein
LESRTVDAGERETEARAFHSFSLSRQLRPLYCVTEIRINWNAVIVRDTGNCGTTAATCDNDNSNGDYGRAIAQAVSRWLSTAAARVRSWSGQVGFVVDKVALGQVFSEYFGFPCQSSVHQLLHNHPHLSGAGTVGQKLPQYKGLSPTILAIKIMVIMMMIPTTTVIIRPAEIRQVALALETFVTAL